MTEMYVLINMLIKADIPFEVYPDVEGTPQVWYPTREKCICDVICHRYSYGGREGKLEIMGLVDEAKIGDSVEGYLTANQVFERINNHYNSK
jgi:hypothetical protein